MLPILFQLAAGEASVTVQLTLVFFVRPDFPSVGQVNIECELVAFDRPDLDVHFLAIRARR